MLRVCARVGPTRPCEHHTTRREENLGLQTALRGEPGLMRIPRAHAGRQDATESKRVAGRAAAHKRFSAHDHALSRSAPRLAGWGRRRDCRRRVGVAQTKEDRSIREGGCAPLGVATPEGNGMLLTSAAHQCMRQTAHDHRERTVVPNADVIETRRGRAKLLGPVLLATTDGDRAMQARNPFIGNGERHATT